MEVTVSGGKTWVDRVVAVIDAGYAVSPDGMKAQIESGVIYGLSAAMYGEITIENGAVAQSSFADYDAIRMHDAPVIETHIINSGAEMGGAGEPGTPGVAPALANAILMQPASASERCLLSKRTSVATLRHHPPLRLGRLMTQPLS